MLLLHGLLQSGHVQTVAVEGDREDLGIVQMEGLQGRQIAGRLHHHLVTGIEHHGGEHVQCLLRAVGDDDVAGVEV